MTLSKWLKANGMPPPLLPLVCGYAPLASDILGALQGGWGGGESPLSPGPPAMVAAGGDGGSAGAAGSAPEDKTAVVPTGVGPAAAGRGSNSKMAAANAARAARNSDLVNDADNTVR